VQHADRVRVWSVAASSTVLLALVFVRLYLVVAEDSALRARQDLVERQTQFATMAAHELRTPLTSLRGSLGTLQRARGAGLPVPDQEELVQMAVRQADRLARLCADLDVIVQSDVGAVAVTHDRVVVRAVAEDVVASLGATALRRTSIAVPDDVTATADPDRLAQVLDNLVRNALRHAPGSPVRIGAVRDGASVHVDVADDGPGLSPEVAAGAFELFRLRDGDATGGFGIGLWIVHELVTAMAGEVSYDGSRGGARFRVTLPAATR
jgi:signal transduction histidine kinase